MTGTFTGPQRDLYAAVLSAQKQLIELCTESARYSLHNLHRKSVDLLKQELNQLGFGIMGGDLEKVLYPHYLSHSIGVGQSSLSPVVSKTWLMLTEIDLHESAHFDRMAALKEGHVITVEPGDLHVSSCLNAAG